MPAPVVRTILGDITPEKCGVTLPHEHLSMDYEKCTVPCISNVGVNLNKIELKDLHWIHIHPYSHPFNLKLRDEPIDDVVKEVAIFKELGGATIVENTVRGITPDLSRLVEISKRTDVQIVAGTGLYLDHSLSDDVKARAVEKIHDDLMLDIERGAFGEIRCGLIGEMGTSWPISGAERKNLQAAALTQEATGAPVMIHPGRNKEAPLEALRIYTEAGGSVKKCAMAHLDRTLFCLDELTQLGSEGCYLELDHFGIEVSYYQNNPSVDMPSDAQRISNIKLLIQEGYIDHILISHDIHTRHRLTRYGGHGFGHILQNVVPKMLARGISRSHISKILKDNPRSWLSFSSNQ